MFIVMFIKLHHFRRSVDSVFEEVKMISDLGVKELNLLMIYSTLRKDFVEFLIESKENLNLSFFFSNCIKRRSLR